MMTEDMIAYMKRANRVIAVSPQIRTQLKKGISKVYLIPNGIFPEFTSSYRKMHGIPQHAFVIGYAGRFTFEKAILGAKICTVLKVYTRHQRSVYLLVAGRDSEKNIVNDVGIRLKIFGHITDMLNFYRICNVVIGSGRTALEAAGCDVPTIAVGERRWIGLLNQKNINQAFQSNFGDHGLGYNWTKQQLLQQIRWVRLYPKTAHLRAQQLGKFIRRAFSAQRTTQQLERIYDLD